LARLEEDIAINYIGERPRVEKVAGTPWRGEMTMVNTSARIIRASLKKKLPWN